MVAQAVLRKLRRMMITLKEEDGGCAQEAEKEGDRGRR